MAVITIKRLLPSFIIAMFDVICLELGQTLTLNKHKHFQCGAWINILCDHAEKRHPDGWILASEHPQNRVLFTGECLIHTNIYTSDMSSKTRYFPLIPVSDSWDHSCFPAASCSSSPWTRRAGDGPRVVAKSPNHPACLQDEPWKRTCDLTITASCGPKWAPTVKPNLLKRGSELMKERQDGVTKERAFQSSPWDSWRLI